MERWAMLELAVSQMERALAQAYGPGAALSLAHASVDFIQPPGGPPPQAVELDVQKTGRTMAFAGAYLLVGGQRVARVSAVFQIGDDGADNRP